MAGDREGHRSLPELRGVVVLAVMLLPAVIMPAAMAQGVTVRVSGDIVIPREETHQGSAVAMNGRIHVDGTLNGDALTMNGDITVTGTVTGSVRTFNGDIILTSSAVVGGDVWSANGRIQRDPGATVRGQVQPPVAGPPLPGPSTPSPAPTPPGTTPPSAQPAPPMSPGPWDGWWPWGHGIYRVVGGWIVVGFVVLAAVTASVFPGMTRRIGETLRQSPGEALLAGAVLWFLIPVLALVLTLSIVGIPLLAFIPLMLMLIGLAGFAGASQLIGDRLLGGFGQRHSTAAEAIVGAALLGILIFVPVLGWLTLFLAPTWGVGAILVLLLRRVRGTAPPPTQPAI